MRARPVVVLILLAALVRGLFLAADPHPVELAGLAASEGEVARNIVDHGEWFVVDKRALREIDALQVRESELVDPSSFDYSFYDAHPRRVPDLVEPLGPGLLLAGFWAVSGDQSYIWLQVLQLVVGSLLTAVVVWLSLALFARPRAALAAGALWAVSPTLAYFGVLPFYETWAVFATLAVVALYVGVRDQGAPAAGLLAVGAAIGAATLFRQGILLLVPALALAELAVSRRRALRTAALVGIGCAVALVPWTARNLHEFGEPRPTNGVGGQVLWEGLGEDNATFGAVRSDAATLRAVHAERPDLEYGTPAYDSYLRSKALTGIGDHPLSYARLVLRRTAKATLLNRSPWPRDAIDAWEGSDRGIAAFAIGQPLYAAELGVAALFDPLLFVLAAVASALLWQRRRQELLLLWLAWASVLVVPLLVSGVEARYVAPGLPLLMILAGISIEMVGRWARKRSARLLR